MLIRAVGRCWRSLRIRLLVFHNARGLFGVGWSCVGDTSWGKYVPFCRDIFKHFFYFISISFSFSVKLIYVHLKYRKVTSYSAYICLCLYVHLLLKIIISINANYFPLAAVEGYCATSVYSENASVANLCLCVLLHETPRSLYANDLWPLASLVIGLLSEHDSLAINIVEVRPLFFETLSRFWHDIRRIPSLIYHRSSKLDNRLYKEWIKKPLKLSLIYTICVNRCRRGNY